MELYYQRKYRQQIRKDGNSIGLFLFISTMATSVLAIIIMLATSFVNKDLASSSTSELSGSIINLFIQCIGSIFMFFICGVFYCKVTKTSLNETIQFKKTKFSTLTLLVLLGYATTFIAAYLSALFNAGISLFGFTTDFDITFNSSDWISKTLYIVGVSIIPALIEEFVFRGIILGKLRKYGDTFALFISSLLFGMMHGNLQQIPFAFIGGLAFGFITIKANSLLPAMIVHFMNNFVSVMIDIITYNKFISETMLEIIYAILMLTALVLGLISVKILSKRKGFFEISGALDIISFKEKIRTFFISVGMILFTVNILTESLSFILMDALKMV